MLLPCHMKIFSFAGFWNWEFFVVKRMRWLSNLGDNWAINDLNFTYSIAIQEKLAVCCFTTTVVIVVNHSGGSPLSPVREGDRRRERLLPSCWEQLAGHCRQNRKNATDIPVVLVHECLGIRWKRLIIYKRSHFGLSKPVFLQSWADQITPKLFSSE